MKISRYVHVVDSGDGGGGGDRGAEGGDGGRKSLAEVGAAIIIVSLPGGERA